MCRTRPRSDRLEGGHERVASCFGSSPAHFISNVARWPSSQDSSEVRSSGGVLVGAGRSTAGQLVMVGFYPGRTLRSERLYRESEVRGPPSVYLRRSQAVVAAIAPL